MDIVIFVLSKLLGLTAKAESWILLCLLLALWHLSRAHMRAARLWLTGGIALLVVVVSVPIGVLLIRPLEAIHLRPDSLPQVIDGIIVLGGAESGIDPAGEPMLSGAAERLSTAVAMARRYPQAKLITSGGSATLFGTAYTGADVAARFFDQQGIDPARVILERQSMTTTENARRAFAIVAPKPGQHWLLVTSAFHMARSVQSFDRAGWTGIIPWPTDYRSTPMAADLRWHLSRNIQPLNAALHEYVGLAAYWILGR